jgi:S1-C subfamily serine protease
VRVVEEADMIRRRVVAVLLVSWLAAVPGLCLAGGDPADGTVFIRVVGTVRALRGDDPRMRREVLVGRSDVTVATGTGFVVSPDGWIVTNRHVVSGDRRVVLIDGEKVEIAVEVQRIEVVVPGNRGESLQFLASVTGSDAELDLAILYVSGQNLPYVSLGDSDAIASGDPVRALGYPFGGQLEIGRDSRAGADVTPGITVSPGSVSSLRRDNAGDIRYVQTTAPLNPGNSGGPIVDADGYVVAVAQLEITDGRSAGVGFGVPVNVVKRFLRRHALDNRLPATMVDLAGYIDVPSKGLRLRVPDGFADHSPFRLRLDTAAAESALALRIDRLVSPRSLDQVENAFLLEGVFDRFRAGGTPRRVARTVEGRRMIEGYVTGSDPTTGHPMSVVYAVIDADRELIVARYIGTAEIVALNRSVLQASLTGLEVRALMTAEIAKGLPTALAPTAVSGASTPVPVPAGWLVEPGAPSSCAGLPAPSLGFSAMPAGDFTVQFRAAWRPAAADAVAAARACAPERGALGAASYASAANWWGVPYRAEGAFVAGPGGVWHLEAIAPASKMAFVLPAFTAWVGAFTP